MVRTEIGIKGMHCNGCAKTIQNVLSKMPGVKSANVEYTSAKADIDFDEKATKAADIEKRIQQLGYKTSKA